MNNLIIPSSPADRLKIRSAMKEISNTYARIEGERSYIKEAIDKLSEDFELPKKYLRKVASAYHKQNIAETTEVADDVETLYDAVFAETATS
jgi:hypothetical protein